MNMREVKRIDSEVQLLVEGNDQRNFFEALVDHLKLDNSRGAPPALPQKPSGSSGNRPR